MKIFPPRSYTVLFHVWWIVEAGNHWLGCLPGIDRRAHLVWQRLFGGFVLRERWYIRRSEVFWQRETHAAAASLTLTLGLTTRCVARRRSARQGIAWSADPRNHAGMPQEPRRMLAPWSVEEGESSFVVRTANGFVVSAKDMRLYHGVKRQHQTRRDRSAPGVVA
jgi:hypothetical protein